MANLSGTSTRIQAFGDVSDLISSGDALPSLTDSASGACDDIGATGTPGCALLSAASSAPASVVGHSSVLRSNASHLTRVLVKICAGEDVVLVKDAPLTPSVVGTVNISEVEVPEPADLWPLLSRHSRSVQLVELQDAALPPVPSVRASSVRHAAARVCVFWLRDETWSHLDPSDPEVFVDSWGTRCRRLAVVERRRPPHASAVTRLLRYDRAQTISSLMVGAGGPDDVQVLGHTIDCVRQQMEPRVLFDSRLSRQPSGQLYIANRVQLSGRHLRVTTTVASDTPYITVDPDDPDELVGVEAEMLRAVSAALGFRYTLMQPSSTDGLFGSQRADGSWTGVIGMLVAGEADMAIGDISVTLERSTAVDYAYPFHIEPVSFFMLRPEALPRWLVIAAPFDASTWLLLLLALLATVGALRLLGAPASCASGAVWAVLMRQTVPLRPRLASGSAGRLLLAAWMAFCLTLTICYQTLLTSQLSVPQYPAPIDSLPQLARSAYRVQSAHKIAVSQYLETFRGTNSVLARIPEKLSFFPVERRLRQLPIEPGTAYVEELAMLRREVAERPNGERFYISRARFYKTGLAWPVRAGACFRPQLDRAVLRLLQAGLVQHWMHKEVHGLDGQAAARALTVDDLSAAFLALAAGASLATVTFVLELALGKRR